jgi:hypothetical protein
LAPVVACAQSRLFQHGFELHQPTLMTVGVKRNAPDAPGTPPVTPSWPQLFNPQPETGHSSTLQLNLSSLGVLHFADRLTSQTAPHSVFREKCVTVSGTVDPVWRPCPQPTTLPVSVMTKVCHPPANTLQEGQ